MRLVAKFILVFCALNLTVAVGQDSTGLVWICPNHSPGPVDGYKFTETFDPDSLVRVDYIKRPEDRAPIPFYINGRGIGVALGHTRELVLINDELTAKVQRVTVADLRDHMITDVSSEAQRLYEADVRPDPRLYVNPQGYALSPDDRVVLVRMVLTYVGVDSAKLAGEVGGKFKPRWYAVDTSTGRVLRTFKGKDPPQRWY
jgi:hypothetical protein